MPSSEIFHSYYRWMVPYWAELHRQSSFFANLAPELQARQLAEALEADHPATAQEVRDWNRATRRAMLAVLDEQLRAGHKARQQALWSMRKGVREVHCLVVYVSTGFDLRLLEAGEMLRTELCRDTLLLEARAKEWQRALTGTGWK